MVQLSHLFFGHTGRPMASWWGLEANLVSIYPPPSCLGFFRSWPQFRSGSGASPGLAAETSGPLVFCVWFFGSAGEHPKTPPEIWSFWSRKVKVREGKGHFPGAFCMTNFGGFCGTWFQLICSNKKPEKWTSERAWQNVLIQPGPSLSVALSCTTQFRTWSKSCHSSHRRKEKDGPQCMMILVRFGDVQVTVGGMLGDVEGYRIDSARMQEKGAGDDLLICTFLWLRFRVSKTGAPGAIVASIAWANHWEQLTLS